MENLNSQSIIGLIADTFTINDLQTCSYASSNYQRQFYPIPVDFMKVYPGEFIPSISALSKITLPFYKKLIEFYQMARPDFFSPDRDWAGMPIEEILAELKSAK